MDNTFVVLKTGPAGSPDEKKESFINFWNRKNWFFTEVDTQTSAAAAVLAKAFPLNAHKEIAWWVRLQKVGKGGYYH